MSEHKCPTCGSDVRIVGGITSHGHIIVAETWR